MFDGHLRPPVEPNLLNAEFCARYLEGTHLGQRAPEHNKRLSNVTFRLLPTILVAGFPLGTDADATTHSDVDCVSWAV